MNFNATIQYNNKTIKIDFLLLSILLIAAFLRFYHLGFQSAWLDEIHTLKEADPNLSLKEFNDVIMLREGIPHLYFLLVRMFSTVFGHTTLVIRLLSAIVGVASVYMIFLIGKEILNKKTGYIAALLMTVNLFHIEHSQEGRSYALMVFFVLLATHRMLLFIKDVNIKNTLLLGLFIGLIPNAHPFGLLNVLVIYSFLLYTLLTTKNLNRIHFFKNGLLSAVIFLIIFSPVYPIIAKVSDIQSFWIPEATLQGIKNVFNDISGRNDLFFYFNLIAFFTLFIIAIYILIKKSQTVEDSKTITAFVLIFLWISIVAGVIIFRSYTGISIILNRYFIGVLPALILITAIVIAKIPKTKISYGVASALTLYGLYFITIEKNYYNTITKAEFEKVANEIIEKNTEKHKIYSSWGWLMSYYFDPNNETKIISEMNLSQYIDQLEYKNILMESFWYMDGNSRPFSVDEKDQKFLDEHYIEAESIEKNDAWAKHFVLKNGPSIKKELVLSSFNPFINDGKGNGLIFENSTIISPKIDFLAGNYTLVIQGNSHPKKPIDGINAHLNVKLNNKIIDNYYLSENEKSTEKMITFTIDAPTKGKLSIEFDNDIFKDGADRNVILYGIKLMKDGQPYQFE
jgi:uncharacterized membrane protein